MDRAAKVFTPSQADVQSLSVIRLLIAGGISAALIFILCWVGAELPYDSPALNYVRLFTSGAYPSTFAFTEGVSWSLASGGIIGALVALVYNAMAKVGR